MKLLPIVLMVSFLVGCNDKGGSSPAPSLPPEQKPDPRPTDPPVNPVDPQAETKKLREEMKPFQVIVQETLESLRGKGVVWTPSWEPNPQVLLEYKLDLRGEYPWSEVSQLFKTLRENVQVLVNKYSKVFTMEEAAIYSGLIKSLDAGAEQTFLEESVTMNEYCFKAFTDTTEAISNTIRALMKATPSGSVACGYLMQSLQRESLFLRGVTGDLDLRPFRSLYRSPIIHLEIIRAGFQPEPRPMDLSPLAGMVKLEVLGVQEMGVKNVSALSNLKALRTLDLADNKIQDLSPIKELPNLEVLILRQNKINSIESLTNLRGVSKLDLSENAITSIQAVAKLKRLTQLSIRKNQVEDLSPLSDLVQLQFLDVRDNLIESLAPLFELYQLRTFYGDGNRLFQREESCPTKGRSKQVNSYCEKFLHDS